MFSHMMVAKMKITHQFFKYQGEEPEPQGAGCIWPLGAGAAQKKLGAGAAKNMRLLYRLLEDKNKKHKEIVNNL